MVLRIIQRGWRESIRSESGASSLRALLIAILLTLVAGQTIAWAAGWIGTDPNIHRDPPSTSPFISDSISLSVIGPPAPVSPFERLMSVAQYFQTKSYVPYVFGGSGIGSANVCQACSACILAKRLPASSSLSRSTNCAACRSCGIDCSNFVNRIFEDAGMGYRFADTSTLRGTVDPSLESQYGFINIGHHIDDARPGDILLQKNHVVLVLAVDHVHKTIDYIHASRGSRRSPVGGIERVRSSNMFKLGRSLEKILRHRDLIQPEDHAIPLSQALLKELRGLAIWQV